MYAVASNCSWSNMSDGLCGDAVGVFGPASADDCIRSRITPSISRSVARISFLSACQLVRIDPLKTITVAWAASGSREASFRSRNAFKLKRLALPSPSFLRSLPERGWGYSSRRQISLASDDILLNMLRPVALCLLAAGLIIAAPAPAPSPSTFYQRPINADCATNISTNAPVATGSINYFPSQFYIVCNLEDDGKPARRKAVIGIFARLHTYLYCSFDADKVYF